MAQITLGALTTLNTSTHLDAMFTELYALRVGTTELGYGTGSGGTVTQATSKSTGVTLNKTNGSIVTHAASLAAGTTVGFLVANNLVAATDVVIVNIKTGPAGYTYRVGVDGVAAGSFQITLRNESAGSLAEAVTISFAVIKAVTA